MKRSRIGMNVGFLAPYMPMFPVNDRMKTAEHGWKNGETQVWGVQPGTAGTYTVLYDGGTPSFRGGSLWAEGAGRWKLETSGGELKVKVPDTGKTIQVLLQGTEGHGHELAHAFRQSKAAFRVMRLLDPMNANDAQGVLTAANRVKPEDQFWSGDDKPAPLEPFIAYAAETGTILWLTVPHTADDTYVDWLAKACAIAGVRVRVEYSNETWNSRTNAGGRTWHPPGTPPNDGGVPALARKAGMGTLAYTLARDIELGKRFRSVMPPRDVEVVYAVQVSAGADDARKAWNAVKPKPGDVQLLAIAPYMGDNTTSTDPQDHANAYLAKAKRWQQGIGDTMSGMPSWVKLARDTGTRLVCYEANNEPKLGLAGAALKAQQAAQSLPETGEAVGRYIDALIGAGVEELCMFVDFGPDTASNTFGLSNDHRKIDGPKYAAVFERAAKYQFEDGYGGATPTPTPPVVTPTPTPTDPQSPTPTPETVTWAQAVAMRNGEPVVKVTAAGVSVFFPLPASKGLADTTFTFAAKDGKAAPP